MFSVWYGLWQIKKLAKRTQSHKVLTNFPAFRIASYPKYDGYQRELASMVYKFFDKKSALLDKFSGSGIDAEQNYELANELHKQIIREFKRIKVY